MTYELCGWFFDLYDDPRDGLVLWLLGDDGQRHRLHHTFPITFYAAGPENILNALARYLANLPVQHHLSRMMRRDLFCPKPVEVLAVTIDHPSQQPGFFQQAARRFPQLTYYDADIPLALRFGAMSGVFPLARCRVLVSGQDEWMKVSPLDDPWEIDPQPAPLRVLSMSPDVNPTHAIPRYLTIRGEQLDLRLSLSPERPFLVNLNALLRQLDPDLLVTDWGDTWLFPYLVEMAEQRGLPLLLGREPGRAAARRKERSYFSYGQVIHRGQQVHLFGRWHIDRCNAMMWGDYGLPGVLELSRVTSLPVQVAARVSPGTGISAMQILTALRQGILTPWHKQRAEDPKSAAELFYADQGGLVYQPIIGLHRDVAEIDFISMYPSLMVHFNISPETVGSSVRGAEKIPQMDMHIDRSIPGLIPQTLQPLLEKRVRLKHLIADLPAWHPALKRYRAGAAAHKWLLVTCFGYLGYKNARFGRIEAHQAVTAYGREVLLQAKETAEDRGFDVLHLYVDGLWVSKKGVTSQAGFQPLLDEILQQTGLPIALDGVYRWVAFLPSRRNDLVPVANRYFGVFQDGTIKVRGIEARRLDTPPFIANMQMEMLACLAKAVDMDGVASQLPVALGVLRHCWRDLNAGRIALPDCLVTQRLSRTLAEYRSQSPAADALLQLETVGKHLRPGQRVRFLYVLGKPPVWAWDLPSQPSLKQLDLARYRLLMLRAAGTILQPFGFTEKALEEWLVGRAVSMGLPGLWTPHRHLVT